MTAALDKTPAATPQQLAALAAAVDEGRITRRGLAAHGVTFADLAPYAEHGPSAWIVGPAVA